MAPCSFCGGELEERLVQHEYRWEGSLFIFEDVPAAVCRQCGEKYFDAQVVKAMEKAVLEKLNTCQFSPTPKLLGVERKTRCAKPKKGWTETSSTPLVESQTAHLLRANGPRCARPAVQTRIRDDGWDCRCADLRPGRR